MDKHCIIAIGQNIWGKGSTIKEARKNGDINKTERQLIYFVADPEAFVNDMGDLVHKRGAICTLIEKIDKK